LARNCESENVRRESKLVVPDRNTEAAITSVGNVPDVSIRHTQPLRGEFAELQKKGLKFTSYNTTEKERPFLNVLYAATIQSNNLVIVKL
jgi:hypothetical protein